MEELEGLGMAVGAWRKKGSYCAVCEGVGCFFGFWLGFSGVNFVHPPLEGKGKMGFVLGLLLE